MFCTAIPLKFEIGRRLFENFGKFEERPSKFLEIGKFEKFQMNDAPIAEQARFRSFKLEPAYYKKRIV